MKRLTNIALFFASPFIALAYIIILPFFGMYMFINLAIEAAHKHISEKTTISWNKKKLNFTR